MIVSNLISAQVGETNIDDDVGGSWRWMAEEEVSRDIFDDFFCGKYSLYRLSRTILTEQ